MFFLSLLMDEARRLNELSLELDTLSLDGIRFSPPAIFHLNKIKTDRKEEASYRLLLDTAIYIVYQASSFPILR